MGNNIDTKKHKQSSTPDLCFSFIVLIATSQVK